MRIVNLVSLWKKIKNAEKVVKTLEKRHLLLREQTFLSTVDIFCAQS
jgi:hypothetical protein